MNKLSIKVGEKSVYGNILVYPLCETAKKFAALLNVKSFNHAQLCGIEGLGYLISCEKLPA